MHIEQVKEILERQAETLAQLSSHLSNKGTPLTVNEKTLIRETIAGTWLRDVYSEIRFAFADGASDQITRITNEVLDTVKQFS